jgi:hypothetical protein
MSEIVTSDVEDEPSEVGAGITDQIVQLSQASESPSDFEPVGRVYDPGEIDFESSGWMSYLAEIQGWLRLPETLELTDPTAFLETLARALGFDDPSDAITGADDQLHLTAAALDQLSGRLQRALQLQEEFLADLEAEGGSPSSASGRWRDAWEEDDARADESSGPVSAKAMTWSINEFTYRAGKGKLNLSPSYQRGDVWPNSDAQMLIESILRGIPLPSLIILKPQNTSDAPYEVVDGKQRLTAILRFIGKHPRALERVRGADKAHKDSGFIELFETNYPMFRKKWKNLVGEQLTATKEREYFFPFRLPTGSKPLEGALSDLQGKYYTQIRDMEVQIADDKIDVRDVFEQSSEYKIPVIEYSSATPRQIHEVFNLYNKQGKHLNAEEIRNALYHSVDFMRALMVASGDNDDVETVAPFLKPAWDDLSHISDILDDYGVGSARYRRTKVLSWLASMLLVDSKDKRLSTASHINSLLSRIENKPTDPLSEPARIRDAFELMLHGMDAHSAVDEAWAPKFKDTKNGAKWQELQLIASVLGVTLAATLLGDDTEEHLTVIAEDLRLKTGSPPWQRPSKTQTASQWKYIAEVALRIVEAFDVDLDLLSAALIKRFGYSCVPTLQAAATEA